MRGATLSTVHGCPIKARDAAEGDGVRAARDVLHGAQVEQTLENLLFTESVRRRMIESGQLGDGADVGVTVRSEYPRSWRSCISTALITAAVTGKIDVRISDVEIAGRRI